MPTILTGITTGWHPSTITQGFSLLIPKGEFAAGVERQLAKRGISLPSPVAGSLRSEYRSSVMTVYVNWPTAEQAAQIAQGVVDELTENYEAYWPQLKDAESPPARLMDPIVPVPIAPALRDRFDLPVRIVLGLLAGVALALGWHFLDPAIRARSELERMRGPQRRRRNSIQVKPQIAQQNPQMYSSVHICVIREICGCVDWMTRIYHSHSARRGAAKASFTIAATSHS